MSKYKCKFEPSWKFIRIRDQTSLTSPQKENTFELLHLFLLSNTLKIFVSIRMKYTWYTHKFSNITYLPYNKWSVVIFTILVNPRELYKFIEGTEAGRQTDHNTLASTERQWGQGYRERKQWRSCVNIIKANICIKLSGYK